MSAVTVIGGILLFAAVTAVLFVWGMKKADTQQRDLMRQLQSKGAQKVLHHLSTHDTVTMQQVRTLVKGIHASEFYSRKRAVVQDDREFAHKLVQAMLAEGLLEHTTLRGKPCYKKAKNSGKK